MSASLTLAIHMLSLGCRLPGGRAGPLLPAGPAQGLSSVAQPSLEFQEKRDFKRSRTRAAPPPQASLLSPQGFNQPA